MKFFDFSLKVLCSAPQSVDDRLATLGNDLERIVMEAAGMGYTLTEVAALHLERRGLR